MQHLTKARRSCRIPLRVGVAALLAASLCCSTALPDEVARPQGEAVGFEGVVKPFLERHCTRCHGAEAAKAELRVDRLSAKLADGEDAPRWHEVLNKLNLGEMPPPKEPRPGDDELLAVIDWITRGLAQAAGAEQTKGGLRVIRRLNRVEYRNTMRDLVGLPIDAGEHFPADPATFGFDNVASGLVTSPLHIENYVEAAERVVDLALDERKQPAKAHFRLEYLGEKGLPLASDPRSKDKAWRDSVLKERTKAGRFQGKNDTFDFNGSTFYKELETVGSPPPAHHEVVDLTSDPPQRYVRMADVIFGGETDSRAGGRTTLKFRHFNYDAGVYRLRLRASGYMPQNWDGPLPWLEIRLEPERRVVRRVEFSDAPQDIELTVYREDIATYRRLFNQRSWGVTLSLPAWTNLPAREAERFLPAGPNKPGPSGQGVRPVPVGIHIESIEVEGPYLGAWPPEYSRALLADRPANSSDDEYARFVLRRWITRAYRRPAVETEVEALLALYRAQHAAGNDFVTALKSPLTAVLASPRFLYLIEPQAADASSRRLDDFELASRLSYFLWSTMPDEQLLKFASEGKLRDEKVLRREVHRLLDDRRSAALVENFTGQWLRLRELADFQVDATLYPNFDARLREAMIAESQEFFRELLAHDGSILDFLDADWTMLNQTLAHHYGIEGVRGHQFRRVALPAAAHRGGLVTQASVLTVTSNGIRTLPVHRGVFVLDQLWADPPPPPPPNAGQLEATAPEAEDQTVKERLEQHRRSTTCSACHAKIDPLGFALESYDAIGQWRTHERLLTEVEKEQKGEIIRVPRVVLGEAVHTSATLPDGRSFDNVEQFKRLLLDEKDRFVGGLAKKLLTYALGRGVTFADQPLIEQLRRRCAAADYRIRTLIEEIVVSEAFRNK